MNARYKLTATRNGVTSSKIVVADDRDVRIEGTPQERRDFDATLGAIQKVMDAATHSPLWALGEIKIGRAHV